MLPRSNRSAALSAPPPDQPDRDELLVGRTLSDWSEQTLRELDVAHRLRALHPTESAGKTITVAGRQLLNLASNDYLALSQHPMLIEAAVKATRQYGVGAGASRLVSGTMPLHAQAEERFAAFKHAEAALLLPTGYAANLAVLTTLAGPADLVVMDKLVHASLIDAARASGAEVRTYPHLQLERAEQLLQRKSTGRRFIVTDSVFSMDGDCADLPALCDIVDRCDASLIVDEAHGTGVLGKQRSGLAEHQGISNRIYACGAGGVVVSTASKALGCLGGLITAGQAVIDLLINKARPFIYSTAVPPAQAAAINAAIDVIAQEPKRPRRLKQSATYLREQLESAGWPIEPITTTNPPTPIIPLIVGNEQDASALQAKLLDADIFAPAIRPPTVAPGQSRVRLSLRCDLTRQDLDKVLEAIGQPAQ